MARSIQVALAALPLLGSFAGAHFDFNNVQPRIGHGLVTSFESVGTGVVRLPGGRRVWEAEADAEQTLLEKELSELTFLAKEVQKLLNNVSLSERQKETATALFHSNARKDLEKSIKEIEEEAARERSEIVREMLKGKRLSECPECLRRSRPEVVTRPLGEVEGEQPPRGEVPSPTEEEAPEEGAQEPAPEEVPEEKAPEEVPEERVTPEEVPEEKVTPEEVPEEKAEETKAERPARGPTEKSEAAPPAERPLPEKPVTAELSPEEKEELTRKSEAQESKNPWLWLYLLVVFPATCALMVLSLAVFI